MALELNYKTFGQGAPIIILHGLFGTLDNWQTIAKKLAEQYSVYILDQRNHGRSPHVDTIDYPSMAEDLAHFMESNWIYKAHIVGHSMGGKTAMQFALNYADLVDHLIVVDIAPKKYPEGHQLIFEALTTINLEQITNRKEADAFLETKIEDFGVRQFLLKNLSRNKEGQYQWKMNLPVIHKFYSEILLPPTLEEPFSGETLFVKGGKSNYIQEEDWPLVKQHFPNARLETIRASGHWVHAEAPQKMLETILRFLPD